MELIQQGVYWVDGKLVPAQGAGLSAPDEAREKTIAYSVLRAHDRSKDKKKMRIKFDALISHDITYVGIIQTARASGLRQFPVPYAMTNCHNSLCAVGGTINEDDHAFGLSAAKKYGGIYVPANQAVIHQYAREALAFCGGMILGSDSHTRYGCYGTMGVGEGGPELVKQLLSNTYDVDAPEVIAVYLEGAPRHGIGPHDVAIALCGAVFQNGFVKNKVLEFVGPGGCEPLDGFPYRHRRHDHRNHLPELHLGDRRNRARLLPRGGTSGRIPCAFAGKRRILRRRGEDRSLQNREHDCAAVPSLQCVYDPRVAGTPAGNSAHGRRNMRKEFRRQSPSQSDRKNRRRQGDGGSGRHRRIVPAACMKTSCEAAAILDGGSIGNGYFDLSIYPSSSPIAMAITKDGTAAKLMEAGAVIKPAFCGPCFGAGDTPAHGGLSIRHATRNFPNREGSKPGQGQISGVALMDARSIAATAANGGALTAATDLDYTVPKMHYHYDGSIYEKRCYYGFGKADPSAELKLGPNITDWPKMYALEDNLLLKLAAVIQDDVTTTDELIPSGETSSYRSNPLKLSGICAFAPGTGVCRTQQGGACAGDRAPRGQYSAGNARCAR